MRCGVYEKIFGIDDDAIGEEWFLDSLMSFFPQFRISFDRCCIRMNDIPKGLGSICSDRFGSINWLAQDQRLCHLRWQRIVNRVEIIRIEIQRLASIHE